MPNDLSAEEVVKKRLKAHILNEAIALYHGKISESLNGRLGRGDLDIIFKTVGSPQWLTKTLFNNELKR